MNLPFPLALAFAGITGFIALGYELLWTRLYSFASGSRAQAFGTMLGFYLLGLAVGSLLSRFWQRDESRDRSRLIVLSRLVLLSNLVAFCVVPAASWLIVVSNWVRISPLSMVGSALLGTLLPLLCHLAIPADEKAGARMSYIYLANIVGSGAGSLITGFLLMDCLKLWQIAALLLSCSLVVAVALACYSRSIRRWDWAVGAVAAGLLCSSYSQHDRIYERLQLEDGYRSGTRFANIVESRHGVITVTTNRAVFGGGVYDGIIETKLTPRTGLVRPYFVSAIHPNPKDVLVVGMSAGAWTQILASHPQVEHVTVVEINRAYLQIIRAYPQVSSILTNPKVEIIFDDGRRWLRRNPQRKFDAIMMNTTFHWREFVSALLSKEFLEMGKTHLKPDGFMMWNCTGSDRAARTGLEVFPYTMMVINNCVGSLSPLQPDAQRWRDVLTRYQIDGQPLFDLTQTADRDILEQLISFASPGPAQYQNWRTMDRKEMEEKFGKAMIITDDNLGHEYSSTFRTLCCSLIPGLNRTLARLF